MECVWSLKAEKKEIDSRASGKEGSPANTFVLAGKTQVGLLSYRTVSQYIYLCCFKPLHL